MQFFWFLALVLIFSTEAKAGLFDSVVSITHTLQGSSQKDPRSYAEHYMWNPQNYAGSETFQIGRRYSFMNFEVSQTIQGGYIIKPNGAAWTHEGRGNGGMISGDFAILKTNHPLDIGDNSPSHSNNLWKGTYPDWGPFASYVGTQKIGICVEVTKDNGKKTAEEIFYGKEHVSQNKWEFRDLARFDSKDCNEPLQYREQEVPAFQLQDR